MHFSNALIRRGTGRALAGASALVIGSLMVSAPAFAQQAAADEGLEDIIVTARKVAENLQDVPVAITAFSGEDLVRQNVQRFQDVTKFTPSLSIRPGSSSPGAVTITMRGLVQTDVLVTLDPSVGTYVDGIYWARAYGLNGDFLDVSNVQVLKGPQGTLFGRNTTGGALVINSNNPDLSGASGRASLTYGRYNEFQATGVLNIPFVTDKIGARVAIQRTSRDGYTTNTSTTATAVPTNAATAVLPFVGSPNGLKYDNRNRWTARGKLEFKPTEDFSLLFAAEYFDMDERAPAREILLALPTYVASNTTYSTGNTGGLFVGIITGNAPAAAAAPGIAALNAQAATLAANPGTTANNEVPYVKATTETYTGTASLDTAFGNVKLIVGHRKIDTYAGVDLEGSSFPVHFTEGQQVVKQDSAELQVTGKAFSDAVDFALGGFYFAEDGFDQSISIVVPAINPSTSHFYGLIDNKSVGIYGQATWHISDKLSFTGGLRYSDDKKGLETRNNNYNRTTSTTTCSIVAVAAVVGPEIVGLPACALARSDSFDGISYTAGFEYKASDDMLLYAKTAKGFRSGGQNLRAPSAAFFIPFQPEIAYSYEIGLKSEFLDKRVRLNLAAYTTRINNIQRSTLIANPAGAGGTATILGNAGKARMNGVEAELQAVVAEGFRITASGALTDPKYIRYSDASGDRSFERFTSVSKSQFSLAADYTTTVGAAKVNARVDYAWLAAQPSTEYNFPANPSNAAIIAATTKPAQGLLGARLSASFNDDRYELAVFGRNIGNNRDYVNSLLVAPLGYISSVRYEPATYGLTGTVKF